MYSCRKFFGVADGAYLYTDAEPIELEIDHSYDRMRFLLGRFEKGANEFYCEFVSNNLLFDNEPLKAMSRLTHNLLRAIDYEFVAKRRTENFLFLHEKLKQINKLELSTPDGAFMYPLYIDNGSDIRKKLQEQRIYIPTLWPDVFEACNENDLEYDLAKNILPLPVDQRYCLTDMQYIVERIKLIKN